MPATNLSLSGRGLSCSGPRNPCPVCDRTKDGDCRIGDGLILCSTWPDADAGHPEWKWLKRSKDGRTGVYVPRGDERDFDRERWARQQKQRLEQHQKQLKALPSIEAKDRANRANLDGLTLSDGDRERLRARGLTDAQIDSIGYKSGPRGILCPIRDHWGRVGGIKVWDWDAKDESGNLKPGRKKYCWQGQSGQNVLNDGELPIAVYGAELAHGVVALTEGMELKPALASARLNLPVIGTNGSNFVGSWQRKKEALEAMGASILRIYPDAGAITNPQLVEQYRQLIQRAQADGYEVQIAWWGQFLKHTGDIDEIDDRAFAKIRYLTPDGFESIRDKPYLPTVPPAMAYELALSYGLAPPADDEPFWEWFKGHKAIPLLSTEGGKKTLASISQGVLALGLFGCNCGAKDLQIKPELLPYVEGRPVVIAFDQDEKPETRNKVNFAIKRLGTALKLAGAEPKVMTWDGSQGKGLDDLIANDPALFHQAYRQALPFADWKQALAGDIGPLVTETRNERYLGPVDILNGPKVIGIKSPKGTGKSHSLAEQVKQIALPQDIPVIVLAHREQLVKELAERFGLPYRTEYSDGEVRRDQGYCLCINSLHPGANPAFNPSDWEGCWLVADEVEQVIWDLLNSSTCRATRAAILETFSQLLNVASRIIVADADLSRLSLDYIRAQLDEPVTPAVIVNEYQSQDSKDLTLYRSEAALLNKACETIDQGKPVLIHTGGARTKSNWGTKNLERILSTPGLRILRIDAESVSDPDHPAYGVMGALNEVLPFYDVVIASPTLETGVSIDIKGHFDAVFAFGSGVQTVEAFCQSLERLREPVPRYAYIPDYSTQRIGNGSDEARSLLKAQGRQFKANAALIEADSLAALEGRNQCHTVTWAKYAAKHNHGFKNYRQAIRAKLEAEGYTITESDTEDPLGGGIASQVAKMAYQEECEQIASAPILEPAAYERISKQRAKTQAERHAERKTNLAHRYATEDVTPDLIEMDDSRGWYPGLLMHYYLTLGQPFLKSRDRKKAENLAPDGKAFGPDLNASLYSCRVEMLKALGIEQFFDLEQTFTSASLAEWFERIKQYRWDIRDGLNMAIHLERDSPIGVAQRLLGLLGLRLTCIGNFRTGEGQRERRYQMQNLDPDSRQAIFSRWFKRDCEREEPLALAA